MILRRSITRQTIEPGTHHDHQIGQYFSASKPPFYTHAAALLGAVALLAESGLAAADSSRGVADSCGPRIVFANGASNAQPTGGETAAAQLEHTARDERVRHEWPHAGTRSRRAGDDAFLEIVECTTWHSRSRLPIERRGAGMGIAHPGCFAARRQAENTPSQYAHHPLMRTRSHKYAAEIASVARVTGTPMRA